MVRGGIWQILNIWRVFGVVTLSSLISYFWPGPIFLFRPGRPALLLPAQPRLVSLRTDAGTALQGLFTLVLIEVGPIKKMMGQSLNLELRRATFIDSSFTHAQD